MQVGGTAIAARHVLIATSARPADLRMPGAEHVITSDQFLDLDELPPRIVFLGGGYVSFELAHVPTHASNLPYMF